MGLRSNARINWISEDAVQVLKLIAASATEPLVIAEVGVGIGATTKQFLRVLKKVGGGELHLFDRQHVMDRLMSDLASDPNAQAVRIVSHANPDKLYASYAWELAKMARDLDRAGDPVEIFDFVYLDGAHAFLHDAGACAVLKRLLKPGGYLVLDDMRWTFNKSTSANPIKKPEIGEAYTEEQLDTPHVALVADVLLRSDPHFEEIRLTDEDNPKRGVFRRIPNQTRQPLWRRAFR